MACVVRGYEEEVEQEQLARNLVYLDQCETVLGEPVNNITPHLQAVMAAMRSPFICGGMFDHKHVAQFLWALHRDYSPRDTKTPVKLLRRVSAIPLEQCQSEIMAFLDLTFMDSPKGGEEEKPIAAGITWLIYRFRHEPWRMSEEETKHTPLRKLYQELRCWQREQGDAVANKSDKKKSDWLADVNEWLKQDPANQKILDEWNAKNLQLRTGEITREEYDQWRVTRFKDN